MCQVQSRTNFTFDAGTPVPDTEDEDTDDDDSTYVYESADETEIDVNEDDGSDDNTDSGEDTDYNSVHSDNAKNEDDEDADAPDTQTDEDEDGSQNDRSGDEDNLESMHAIQGSMTMRPHVRVDYKALHEGTTFLVFDINHSSTGIMLCETDLSGNCEVALVSAQMNLKQGLKMFGQRGENAVGGELRQVHEMKGFQPIHHTTLSDIDKKRALQYLMYLKEKRDGSIKARGCADGRKQRLWTNKEDASSPTVALGSLMLSCAIDAFETGKLVLLIYQVLFSKHRWKVRRLFTSCLRDEWLN